MMFKSEQRLLELNSRLSKIIESTGRPADPTDTTTTLINKASESLNELKASNSDLTEAICALIESMGGVVDPTDTTTTLINKASESLDELKTDKMDLNALVRYLMSYGNPLINTNIDIPMGTTNIKDGVFRNCTSLTSVTIPNSVTQISYYAFEYCASLSTITIPNSITYMGSFVFSGCTNLMHVTLESGFNGNGLDLSVSTKYTREIIVSWLNALKDRTGEKSRTLTIGDTNLEKLTEEDKKIASDKNWIIK